MKWRLLIGSAVALIAAAALAIQAGLPQRADFTGRLSDTGEWIAPEVGAFAPPFERPTLEGQRINLQNLRGAPVIINFWATWCVPCRVEMPILQEIYTALADEGLHILAVNIGEPAPIAHRWVDEMGLTYDILLDENQTLLRAYQVRGQPSTYIIAPTGEITHIYYGPISEGVLRAALSPHFEN